MPYVKLKMPDPSAGPLAMPIIDSSNIKRKWLDVDYTPLNPHPARKLDIYIPDSGDGPFPTIIAIHGGAFSAGTKDDMQVAAYLEAIPHGFAVASVEQRLCNALPDGSNNPDGLFPNPVFDFKAAIRFLRFHAADFMLDPRKFAAAGGSAGGYHATIAAAAANNPALYDDSLGWADISDEVQAAVNWFGVGDMVTQSQFTADSPGMKLPDGKVIKMLNYADVFLGVNAREHPELARLATPATYVTPNMPPILIQHGTADEIVPIECSRHLAKRIEQVCGKDRFVFDEFEGYTHGDERFNDEANIMKMIGWLKKALNVPG